MDSFLKDSFHGFISCKQKSQITRFVLICKDLYMNPPSLSKTQKCVPPLRAWTLFCKAEKSLIRRCNCFLCFLQLHNGQALFQTFQPECCLHVFRFIHYAFFSVCLSVCLSVYLSFQFHKCCCASFSIHQFYARYVCL